MAAKSAAVTRAADELVAPLFAEQAFLLEATNEEIRDALPSAEADYVIACRQRELDPPDYEHSTMESLPSAIENVSKSHELNTASPTDWLQRIDRLIAKIFGPVNGISRPLTVHAAGGEPAPLRSQARMRHVGHSDVKLVIFYFSRPIREVTLVRDKDLIFSSYDFAADTPIEIPSDDTVRNPEAPVTDWEFVDDLEWHIEWSDD